jgi:DNA end-binding protein Ku
VPQGDALVLNTLRYHKELKSAQDLGVPEKLKGARVSPKEIDMALRLIDDMADPWRPEKYHDTYREDLLKRVEAKVKAGQTEEITEPEKGDEEAGGAKVIDLMALLKKSVERKQEKQPRRSHKARRRAA